MFGTGSFGSDREIGRRADAPLRQIEAYWQHIRDRHGTGGIPERREIDPRGIERALHQAFILERIAAGDCQIRVAGTYLSAILGQEARGLPFSRLFEPGARAGICDVLGDVFAGPATARLSLRIPGGIGRTPITGEMCLLPLKNSQGQVNRLLGGIAFGGRRPPAHHRLSLVGSFLRALRADGPGPRMDQMVAARSRPTRVSYLRLVES